MGTNSEKASTVISIQTPQKHLYYVLAPKYVYKVKTFTRYGDYTTVHVGQYKKSSTPLEQTQTKETTLHMLSLTFHNTQVPHGTRPTQRYLKLNPSIFSTCPNILNQTLSNHILALFKSRTSQSLSFTKPANAPAAGVASYHLNSPSQGPSTAFKASVPDQLMLENCLTCSMLSYVIRTAKQSKGEPQDSSIPCCHAL